MPVDQRHSLATAAHVKSVTLTLVLDAAQDRLQVRLQLALHQLHAEDADGAQGLVEALCRRSTSGRLTTPPLTCAGTCAAVPLTVGGAAAQRNPPARLRVRVHVRRAQHHPGQVLPPFSPLLWCRVRSPAKTQQILPKSPPGSGASGISTRLTGNLPQCLSAGGSSATAATVTGRTLTRVFHLRYFICSPFRRQTCTAKNTP